ncbi:MAG: low-specificity L-threonine aldolase, partial [Myxococcales bacterium]|nr:low-specificity L-threonine aldolase [Myxococcales bacterium]
MRRAMAEAAVGDDVWNEDPTVKRLQALAVEITGKAAALFVPSGTMANQVALLSHCRPGDEVLLGWGSHCTNYEAGGAGALAGIQGREIGSGGMFTRDDVLAALQPANVHFPPTRLVWIENTHNRGGGRVFPQARIAAIAELARERGLAVHLDGARLFNAATATGLSVAEILAPVGSASICLSKGLGAPVGSLLVGDDDFIARAYRYRKMLGGGMRQVGIIAAAGIYALENHVARLAEDHNNARTIAETLAACDRIEVIAPETNIVIFDLLDGAPDAQSLIAAAAEHGVLLSQFGPRRVRAVTHLDVSAEIESLVAATVKAVAAALDTSGDA